MRTEEALKRLPFESDLNTQHLGNRWLDLAALDLRPVALRDPGSRRRRRLSQIQLQTTSAHVLSVDPDGVRDSRG